MMNEVVIVDAVRTPIGRFKGALKAVRPDDLGATVIKALVDRNKEVPVEQIDDVIFGNANGAGEENRNVARMSSLLAGLPVSVSGTTVNRLCGSSLDAVSMAARAIISGEEDIIIAGGTESMTRAPFVMAKAETDFSRSAEIYDTTIGWRFVNPKLDEMYGTASMPETAENVAERLNISREEQDEFAYRSQQRAKAAIESNRFADEIVPVTYKDRRGNEIVITEDEHPRPDTTLEVLGKLRPIFGEDGTVTAGNASGINDGASAVLLMSAKKAEELGIKPLAKYISSATAGLEPDVMGLGPIYSTQKLMERANLTIDDFDLIELNEAFASQSIACVNELGADLDRVNVNGGAIALGHPLGASGTRILATLIYEMKKREAKRGLATMCIGVGQGISVAIENID